MSTHPDVLVIGGGIIGLSSAYFLAKAGLSVEVLERSDPGREASWAGAGIVPPGNPDRAATAIDRLRAIGSVRFPELSIELREQTGIENGYFRCGGIEFLSAEDRDILPVWSAEGIRFEQLNGESLQRLEPRIADVSQTVPYYLPDCAQVRNPWHVRAMIAACQSIGVRLSSHASVTGWQKTGSRVTGLMLATGETRQADRYLLASGAWSADLLSPLGCQLEVRPVRGQIALFNAGRRLMTRVVMAGKRYLVPRADGRILVGSTEEPEAGFEKATTPEGIRSLTEFAWSILPVLREAPVEKTWAGLRPGSPDGMPFIGLVPGWENIFVAAGHFRAGIQLSIGTGELVRDLLTGQRPAVPPEAFRPDRVPDRTIRPAFRS